MKVHTLRTRDELQRFVDFGHAVYKDHPCWVPPDPHHLIAQLSGESPSAAHTKVQAFWTLDDHGEVLATIAAVVDEWFNRHWQDSVGHLLHFEALAGHDEAGVAVIRAACDWLGARDCRTARLSFLGGWQLPLGIDAYDEVPTIFHTYNRPGYHRIIKNAGFETERGLVEYHISFSPERAREYRGMVERAAESGVSLRSWDFDRLNQENARFCELTNECFARHWGMPQFLPEELAGLTEKLKDFLVPDFTGFVEVDGQVVGYVYALPDLNQAFHAIRGKDPAACADELQQHLKKIDHGILLIIGVKEGWRGRGINLALAAKSYLAMMERGYKSASYTLVLDDNWPSRRTAEKLGGRVARNFVVYRRELAG